MLELLIERQRSERQTQIGKFFFQTHHRLHQLTDQNHSIQILWLAEVQRLTCPLWVKSGHVRCKHGCPLYPQKRTWSGQGRFLIPAPPDSLSLKLGYIERSKLAGRSNGNSHNPRHERFAQALFE